MTSHEGGTVQIDSPVGAFGRVQTANPITVFDSKLEYGKEALIWDEDTSGGGSATFVADESSVTLDVGTASGDLIVRLSHRSVPYTPGKGLDIIMTGHMGPEKAGVRSRIGFFNVEDGVFLERTSTGVSIVLRTSTSGSAVDTAVAQASWNIDPLDGTGPSGANVDFDNTQVFYFDAQWLGAGRVRCGLFVAGEIVFFHEFINDNTILLPYSKTFTLTLRYELENTGASASASQMRQICASVQSEGDFTTVRVHNHAASTQGVSRAVTTRLPVLVVRPKATFNTKRNRMQIKLNRFSINPFDRDIFYEIMWRGTASGGAFGSVHAESGVEFSVDSTGWTGGHSIDEGMVPISGTGGSKAGSLTAGNIENIFLLLGELASTGDEVAVMATRIGTGTANVHAALAWEELR